MKEKVFTKRSDQTDFREFYSPETTPVDYEKELNFPAQYPFSRGIHPNQYRGRLWTMRQYAGFGSAQETNERFLKLLTLGQTGLSMAFDLPTQMGFDPDDDVSRGEVGRVGVSIATLEDMETVLKDIPLADVSTSMTINATAPILFAFYLAIAKKRGISFQKLRGTLQNDILKEYIARGTYIYPPQASLRLVTDIIEFCMNEVPQWNPISISGYHIREAGSDAVQEVAFTLASAICYARAAIARGLSFDDFAGNLSFFFASHTNLIEEISKFRAARRVWAEIAKEEFGAKLARSMMLRFHAQTGGSTLTAQQPDNNIVRTTIQAVAAILGGCQSLHTNSKDEALSLPSQESATLALRTQQLIAEESGIAHTVDPVGGSYAIEYETARIVAHVKDVLLKIDQMGGSIKAIEKQFFQQQIAERAYAFQKQIETGERGIVGVNKYIATSQSKPVLMRVDPQVETNARERLRVFKKNRNATQIEGALKKLRAVAQQNENMLPALIEAVENHVTLGEIAHTLRDIFGIYRP